MKEDKMIRRIDNGKKKIKRVAAITSCTFLITVGFAKNVKGTAVFYAISETQERSGWCWVASARGVARGETTVTATQSDGVLAVKGKVIDAGGTAEEAKAAAEFYSPNTDFVLYNNALTFNQIKACIDNGHLVMTLYFPPNYSTAPCGHAMFVIGYNDNNGVEEVRYCDPTEGKTKWYPYEYFAIITNGGSNIYEYEKSIFCRLK